MKKLLLLAFVLLNAGFASAENTMADLFNGKAKLTFLGLDFTQAKYVGKIGFTDPVAIQNQHMVSWNNLIEMEPKKFSLQKAFNLKDDQYASKVEDMVKYNKSANVADNITEAESVLTEDQVKKSVAKYSLSEKDGIGVVYVVESLSKTAEKLTVWVTFIDLSTKKVLYTEKVEGKAGGFGFRNYWAGGVYKINEAIDSKLYKKWSKTYKV
ncbi:hypothetical protein [Dyadobacter fanqingshengii]|uniref:Uncharacterized protein n=1 Tax=Dyadobacter fanqingshengii TaxID=2906443 RepID=A0A9X1TB84_9BACT|nr:hypothetical protein [Dyadobacter fanqingshengii]MCF0042621.1 hypothetical protein [Dyadobacter fanqingshengii]USJ36154.1 hypothetical protein NFI81_26165 [Dyadobacter fanqingshengii]